MSALDSGEMTLAEHLSELRRRVVRVALAVGVGTIIGWFLYDPVIEFLKAPYCALDTAYRPTPEGDCALIVTRVLEAFSVRVKVSLVIGLFIAAPVLFHQTWKFVVPGLTERERRYTLPFVALSQLMFLIGAAFAFYVIPKGLGVLLRLGGTEIATLLSAAEYVSFVLTTVVAFGIVFEVPLALVFLAAVGIVTSRTLRRIRPYAIIGNCVVAALVTPTVDIVSMMFMVAPMVILYEVSILAAWLIERARARRAATAAEGRPA